MDTSLEALWARLRLAREKLGAAKYAAEIQGVELAERELASAQADYDTAKAAAEAPKPAPKPAPPPTPKPVAKPVAKPAPVEPVTRDLGPPTVRRRKPTTDAKTLEERAAKARAAAETKRKAAEEKAGAEAKKPELPPGAFWNGFRYVQPTDKAWNLEDYNRARSKRALEVGDPKLAAEPEKKPRKRTSTKTRRRSRKPDSD